MGSAFFIRRRAVNRPRALCVTQSACSFSKRDGFLIREPPKSRSLSAATWALCHNPVGAECRAAGRRGGIDHGLGGGELGLISGLRQLCIEDETVAVLHQQMADEQVFGRVAASIVEYRRTLA